MVNLLPKMVNWLLTTFYQNAIAITRGKLYSDGKDNIAIIARALSQFKRKLKAAKLVKKKILGSIGSTMGMNLMEGVVFCFL